MTYTLQTAMSLTIQNLCQARDVFPRKTSSPALLYALRMRLPWRHVVVYVVGTQGVRHFGATPLCSLRLAFLLLVLL